MTNMILRRPHLSQIEITNICNLKCPMCPRTHGMKRKLEYMDLSLFKKIIDKVCKFNPRNGNIRLQLHHFGESLLHPQLKEILLYCKSKNVATMISSNGTVLTKEKREAIIGNLDRIWISFDSIDKETYEKMRKGANFEDTIEKVVKLIEEKGNRIPLVEMSTLLHENKEDYEKFWREKGVKKFIWKNYHNWRGEEKIKNFTNIKLKIPNGACGYLFSCFSVLVDGSVVPCCMDYNGDMIMGNLKDQSIEEIFTGDKYTFMRFNHLSGYKKYLYLCSECTNYPGAWNTLKK